MKKLLLSVFFVILALCSLVIVASAKEAYLEPIPENLLFENDTVTHFVVFDDEKYFLGSGSTIDKLDTTEIEKSLTSLGVAADEIGTKYLTKFVFPAYMDNTLITYVNVNSSIKTSKYFKNVCGYVAFPGTMTQTHDMNDCVQQLRGIDFGKDSQLTAIPFCFASYAKKLKEVKNFPTANLQSIGGDAFTCAYYAFSGELIINAATVGAGAFNNAITFVTSLVFGESFRSASQQSFSVRSPNETNLGTPHLQRVEFKCDVTQITASGNLKPFYFSEVTPRTEFGNLKCIILSNPANKSIITDGVTTFGEIAPNSRIQFFADSTKDVVYTSHNVSFENATVSYDSFLNEGAITGHCDRCGAAEATPAPALFEFKGLSVPINGDIEIYIGFSANYDAIEEYERITGNKVNFGIVAATQALLGNNAPLDKDGNEVKLENGAIIKAPVNNTVKYISYELRITGFTEEAHKDIMLLLASYVHITDKNGSTVSVDYLQSKQVVNNKFFYVSYNSYGK